MACTAVAWYDVQVAEVRRVVVHQQRRGPIRQGAHDLGNAGATDHRTQGRDVHQLDRRGAACYQRRNGGRRIGDGVEEQQRAGLLRIDRNGE
jgi:hypothetical protein